MIQTLRNATLFFVSCCALVDIAGGFANDLPNRPHGVANQEASLESRMPGISEYLPELYKAIELIGSGEIKLALGEIEKKMVRIPKPEKREQLSRQLSALYGNLGEFNGSELAAVKPVSQRLHRVYLFAYFEHQPALFDFRLYKFKGEWLIRHFQFSSNWSEFEESVPLKRVSSASKQ